MGPLWVPRRMTVIQVGEGLLLHSPNELTPALRAALDALEAPVRWLVAPSVMHTAFLPDYQAAYPAAQLFAAPGLEHLGGAPLEDASRVGGEDAPWAGEVQHLRTEGVPRLNEVAFFHSPSQTLVLTDFAHDVGPDNPWLTRTVFRAIGGYGQLGPTRYFRWLVSDRAAVGRSIQRICAEWDFARVLVGHGRGGPCDPGQLRTAFRAYGA